MCSCYLLPPDGQSSKNSSEPSSPPDTYTHSHDGSTEGFPRQQTTHTTINTRKAGLMERFSQMENKYVRNSEKGYLHFSGLSTTGHPLLLTLKSMAAIIDTKVI